MRKFFLIPLMTLVCSVMAWGATVQVADFAALRSAVASANDGDVIELTQDMEFRSETALSCVDIRKSITIDGKGFSIVGYARRQNNEGGRTNGTLIAINNSPTQYVDVTIKNLTLINERLRAIETRGYIHSLTIDNCTIEAKRQAGTYDQPITIGGNQSTVADITIKNSTIKAAKYYPIVTFNPVNMTITDSKIQGWSSVYFKGVDGSEGSHGSTLTATNTYFDAQNIYSGNSNSFGAFPLEDDGIDIVLDNCVLDVTAHDQSGVAKQSVFLLSSWSDRQEEACSIKIKGANSHIIGQFIDITWNNVPQDIAFTLEGGSYYGADYLTAMEDTHVSIATGFHAEQVSQGGQVLYRIVKDAAVNPETSTLYDLNDNVQSQGDGQNPTTSFELSDGSAMTLEQATTKAGYVEVSNATTVTVANNQTLVINNGLDVQGTSAVSAKPGSALVIGEGGIVTESSANIVLEVTEDEGASLLLDPTITINKNPNLTVKLTTNSKQLTASPWTYVYQRFAIPVQVGVVPTNDFEGELFPGNTSFKNYVFEWNGYDWVTCSSWGALEPFKGYQLANNSKNGGVTYTFTGQLVGNDNSVYNFPTGGFDFFGNSHLAPIYIDSLLKPYESQAVEASVWLYNYVSKNFEAITSEDIADGWAFATEIKPMEGFILNYHGATGSAGMNYASAIWGNPKFDAAIGRPSQSNPAPARNRVSETSNRAIINVVAENGQGDNVKLVEKEKYSAEFENGADASKFVYDNAVSIYASTENGELSRVATNDLTGTLLSFNSNDATNYTITLSNVLGEDYALRDNVTGQTIAFAEGATYTFTQAANTTVPARFEVISAAKMPTALDNVEEAAKVSGIYTITGQYLGHDFTNLPAGVYIVNGVKIVK